MSLAITILATLTLVILFWNRGSGFEKISTFIYACAAYGVAWLGAAVVLFQLYNGPIARLAAVHITAGAVGLAGLVGVVDARDSWWVWPAAVCTILYPLGLCAAKLWR
jgi:hypothetical protein